MPVYSYLAKNTAGNSIKGQESALSEYELKTRLARKDLVIISIKEVKKSGSKFFHKSKVTTSDLVLFCKQLATMVKGGVPLLRAISSISDELKNPVLKSTLDEVGSHIKGGESLSGSIRRFPDIFSSLFVSIIEAGEKVGALDSMLERLGAYLQARDRLNKKIIAALVYPAFIVIFFLIAVAVITLFLVPRFKAIYAGFGANLPVLTRVVFSFSDMVIKNILWVIIIVPVILFLLIRYFKSKKGRRVFDNLILKIPIFGSVIKNAALSKFTRTLATLLSQGIPIAISLDLVSRTSGNVVLESASLKIRDLILDGENIPEAIRKVQLFPSLMIQMVMVGVESGSLPELLDKTADFYEERVDSFVATLTTMIEPILLVVLGGMVGVVIIALYMPIFKLSQAVSGVR